MESHRVLLTVIVLGAISMALLFGRPSITGFVPTETYAQEIELHISESQRFVLSAPTNEPLRLFSFALSGTVAGSGLANVYLSDGNIRRLVYSNRKKPGSAMEIITGMAVSELNIEAGGRIDRIETLPAGYTTVGGAFANECVETCVLDSSAFTGTVLYLDVIVEPGTTLHISGIRFSAAGE
ncbi:MAG: hypothetical protein QW165_03520 [Candidatus Woesearchaeota archaeon]